MIIILTIMISFLEIPKMITHNICLRLVSSAWDKIDLISNDLLETIEHV